MAAGRSSSIVIYAALAGNLLVATTKFGAAAWTGSAAMTSEGVHSLVDTVNQVLLLYGIRRSNRPPDARHPLGHGRELYFWSFIVALLIFSTGAGLSFYEGIAHLLDPHALRDAFVNYWVLGLSFLFEGGSWYMAMRKFNTERGEIGVLDAVRRSKDPTTFTVLFEDSAALVGILIALLGTMLAERLQMPRLDGAASIGIGVVLAATAIFLARESKGLLIGEPAREKVRRSLERIAAQEAGVERAFNLLTVHLAPDQIVVALDMEFDDELTANNIEQTVQRLERRMKEAHPSIIAVFVKPKAAARRTDFAVVQRTA